MSDDAITFHIDDRAPREARIDLLRAAAAGEFASECAERVTFCEDRFGAGLYVMQVVLMPLARALRDDPDALPEIRAAIIDCDMPGTWIEPAS